MQDIQDLYAENSKILFGKILLESIKNGGTYHVHGFEDSIL